MLSQKPRDVDKKTGIDGAGYFGAAGYFLGGMEIVFHFIVVPCCPMSQKPRDVDKKIPSLVFCGIDKTWYFGTVAYFGASWRKFSIL